MDQGAWCLALWALGVIFPCRVDLITPRCLPSHVDLRSSLSAALLNKATDNPGDRYLSGPFQNRCQADFFGLCWETEQPRMYQTDPLERAYFDLQGRLLFSLPNGRFIRHDWAK